MKRLLALALIIAAVLVAVRSCRTDSDHPDTETPAEALHNELTANPPHRPKPTTNDTKRPDDNSETDATTTMLKIVTHGMGNCSKTELQQRDAYEATFERHCKNDFCIGVEPAMRASTREQITAESEVGFRMAKKVLQAEAEPVDVFIYNDEAIFRETGCAGEGEVGYYDGTVHVLDTGHLGIATSRTVAHELAHHVQRSNSWVAPAWLIEGSAEIIGAPFNYDVPPNELQSFVALSNMPTRGFFGDLESKARDYLHAYLFVDYVSQNHEAVFARWVKQLDHDIDAEVRRGWDRFINDKIDAHREALRAAESP